MALTKEQEDYVIKSMDIESLEKQIIVKKDTLETFKFTKQTEIDEEQTKVNGEIQDLQSRNRFIKMTFTLFLQITIPIALFFGTLLITLFVNNNKSHKEIWMQINSNTIELTNRLTRIETKLENLKNGSNK